MQVSQIRSNVKGLPVVQLERSVVCTAAIRNEARSPTITTLISEKKVNDASMII